MIPRLPLRFSATPRTVGYPIEWSPPRTTGNAPEAKTCDTPLVIWSKRLFDVARDGEDVANVGDGDRLPQVDSQLEAVGAVESRDPPHTLWAEAGTGTVGGAAVVRGAQHGHVVLTAFVDVLHVGRLQKGVYPGEMR